MQHNRCRDNAVRQFNSTRKMGGPEFSIEYQARLEQDVNELYEAFVRHNESKNLFAAAKTPAVLFAVVVILYVVSGFFGIIGVAAVGMFTVIIRYLWWRFVWIVSRYIGIL